MQALPDTPLIKHNSDTLEVVRKELNLHQPGRMDESVDRLNDWIKAQPHFKKKDYSREYLECFIINAKGSVESAKGYIEKLCAYKTFGPQYFSYSTRPVDLTGLEDIKLFALPKLTKENHRVFFLRNTVQKDYTLNVLMNYMIKVHFSLEYLLRCYNYSLGIRVILDYRKTDLSYFFSAMKYSDARNGVIPFFKGYGIKPISTHILTTSKAIDLVVKYFRQIVGPELIGQIHVHANIEELWEHIDKDLLPSDCGGKEKTTTELCNEWDKAMSTDEFMEYIKDMFQATIDPSLKPMDKFNDLFLGMPGTFRTLSVD